MYESIHEVPKAWRHLGGYPLSLDQINDIVGTANSTDAVFSVALGKVREGFKINNTVADGIWIGG